ncbi:MAG: histidine kinase [Bacteroidales bacterium]
MKYKEQFIRIFSASLRILIFLSFGFLILYFLMHYMLSGLEFVYLLLLVPVMLVVLFGLVAFTLSEILRLQAWNGEDMLQSYTKKELLSLYGRSFLVVTCGFLLGILFVFNQRDTSDIYIDYLFLLLDLFLTLYAIGSIVKGERLRELNIRNIQSENALLKSQLNPHFLYNTLNNIDALITYNTDKASESVILLSSLLRYMTYQGNQKQVLLIDEINHLKEYISLQQLRMENPAAISFKANIQDESIKIAPMLLMPFIENIFKHAADRIHDNAIKIWIDTDSSLLKLQTENTIKETPFTITPAAKEGGMGLKLVRRRLRLLYPNRHQLQIIQKNQMYSTVLNLYFK